MQWTKALVLGAGILMAAEAAQAKQVFVFLIWSVKMAMYML